MGDKSGIEWTDATWNPIVGCSIVSKGCTNCYAMRTAGARTKHTAKYQGLTKPSKAGPVWTGEVRFWEKALTDPLRWQQPRRIFVNSMGDLFAEEVPDEWIDRCFAVMALCPQHTFQILTKRPERMLGYMSARWQPAPAQSFQLGADTIDVPAEKRGHGRHEEVYQACEYVFERVPAMVDTENEALWNEEDSLKSRDFAWPLPNVWLGTSCEDQERYDQRKQPLQETPAAVHFFSFEPLLGPITAGYLGDWAIVGGESGLNARPMHPDWARSLRDQCAAAGVPFFFKQWGEWAPGENAPGLPTRKERTATWFDNRWLFSDLSPAESEGMHVDDEPDLYRLGKKAAGRLLDGSEWNESPEARP